MAGDLIHKMGFTRDEVCNGGYFEMHGWWLILDELKARELSDFGMAFESHLTTQDHRERYFEWLNGRQPRLTHNHAKSKLSPETQKRLNKLFGG